LLRPSFRKFYREQTALIASGAGIECLIATHAIIDGTPLLHRDGDFELIARVEPKLMLVARSLP
jgi:predicted nucleic acid-binding protein